MAGWLSSQLKSAERLLNKMDENAAKKLTRKDRSSSNASGSDTDQSDADSSDLVTHHYSSSGGRSNPASSRPSGLPSGKPRFTLTTQSGGQKTRPPRQQRVASSASESEASEAEGRAALLKQRRGTINIGQVALSAESQVAASKVLAGVEQRAETGVSDPSRQNPSSPVGPTTTHSSTIRPSSAASAATSLPPLASSALLPQQSDTLVMAATSEAHPDSTSHLSSNISVAPAAEFTSSGIESRESLEADGCNASTSRLEGSEELNTGVARVTGGEQHIAAKVTESSQVESGGADMDRPVMTGQVSAGQSTTASASGHGAATVGDERGGSKSGQESGGVDGKRGKEYRMKRSASSDPDLGSGLTPGASNRKLPDADLLSVYLTQVMQSQPVVEGESGQVSATQGSTVGKVKGKIEEGEEESGESSYTTSDSDSEWEEEAEEAAERKEREKEVAAGMANVREVAVLEAAKVVLVERHGIATALAKEQEETERKAAEMAETLSKEVKAIEEAMRVSAALMSAEREEHKGFVRRAKEREADMEAGAAAQAMDLAAMQRRLEVEVGKVLSARVRLDGLELSRAELESQLNDLNRRAKAKWERSKMDGITSSEGEEMSALRWQIDQRKKQVKEMEEVLLVSNAALSRPSDEEVELERGLKEMTDNLIEKQAQVESLQTEKATLALRLETVTISLQDEREALASKAAKRHKMAYHGLVDVGGDDDLEMGPTRINRGRSGMRLSRKAKLMQTDFGFGSHGNAIVTHLAAAAFTLDSWFMGGASFLGTNDIARAMVWVYVVVLHLWVGFVYKMHSNGVPLE